MSNEDDPGRPVLRIVRGNPDDAEIAALTAALAANAAAASAPESQPEPLSVWAEREAALRHPAGRRPLRPGPGAWRTSYLPR